MSKNIVFIPWIKDASRATRSLPYKYSIASWKKWCDKNNSELFVLNELLLDNSEMGVCWQRYYLFDIQMLPGQNFRNTVSIGTSVNDYINLHRPLGKAILNDVFQNNALFQLPELRPQSVDDISLTAQRRFSVTTDGTGNASLSLSATGETFANVGDWFFAKADSDVFTGTVSNTGAGAAAANLGGLPASSTIEILGYVKKGKASVRNKTLNEATVTASVVNGEVLLGKADIFEVTRIRENDSDGRDFTNKFILSSLPKNII